MPKNKGWKKQINRIRTQNKAKHNDELWESIKTWRQMCVDAAFMAAADNFHMGPTRCEAFGQTMVDYTNEIVKIMNDDTEDGEYAKVKIDERLQKICGTKFDPWEVRYGGK